VFSLLKATDRNLLLLGGQLYWSFTFSKDSLKDHAEYLVQGSRLNVQPIFLSPLATFLQS